MTAAALGRAFATRRTTPRQVAERFLEEAARRADHRWLLEVDPRTLLAQADAATRRWRQGQPRSPIDGVPLVIKDQIDVAGQATSCGTSFLDAVAARDAEVVARLRAAGALLAAKGHLPELALGPTGRNPHLGDARNPWDPTRDTGGSSSGPAAAVAAGLVPLALGTDLGGSLRIPAAHCGCATLKPTRGRLSLQGVRSSAPALDHVGPMASSIEDLVALYDLLTGETTVVPDDAPAGLVAGLCEAWWANADPGVAAQVAAAVDRLERRGMQVVPVSLPPQSACAAAGSLICLAEVARTYGALLERGAPFGPSVRLALALGDAVRPAQVRAALEARRELQERLARVFETVDLLVLPTTARVAEPTDELEGIELSHAGMVQRVAFTLPFNLAGVPCVQIPCGFSDGLPVGLQLVTAWGEEARALAVATCLDPWPLAPATRPGLLRPGGRGPAPGAGPHPPAWVPGLPTPGSGTH